MVKFSQELGWILLSVFLGPAALVRGSGHLYPDAHTLEAGKRQFELMQRDSQLPRYGDCWKSALHDLQQGCQKLTDHEQSRLALQFANCFLAMSGLPTYPCQKDKEISKCLEGISNNAFTSYSNFFTHTQNMCFFLQSQVWQEDTQDTISKLSSVSAKIASEIKTSSDNQQELLQSQKESLNLQRQIAANGSMLSKAIEMSRNNVKEILEEFKASTDEQKMLIFEIFDRVSKLQNLVMSEVSWLYTVIFYGMCLLVVYLITATKRTSDARLWLYLVLTINLVLERLICRWTLPSDIDVNDMPEVLYFRIWLIRKASLFSCFTITGYFAYNFVDYNKANNELLEQIRHQNADLKKQMESFQLSSKDSTRDGSRFDLTDGMKGLDPVTGHDGDVDSGEESDDDTLSFTSTQTDQTWMADKAPSADELSEDSSDDEADQIEASFIGKLISGAKETNASVENVTSLTPRKARRSSRSRSNTPRPEIKPQHSYSLRTRMQRHRQDQNPILEAESPDSFAKAIKKMSAISMRNSRKVRMALMKDQGHFSSDG